MSKPSPIDALVLRMKEQAWEDRICFDPDMDELADELSRLAPLVVAVIEALRTYRANHERCAITHSQDGDGQLDRRCARCKAADAALKAYEEGSK